MKKYFALAAAMLALGYWLGNADLPQKHIQHALDYPRALNMINAADSFEKAEAAHSFVIDTGYLGLEHNSAEKMLGLARDAQDYLDISKAALSPADKKIAIEQASKLTDWDGYWNRVNENLCVKGKKKGKKIFPCQENIKAKILTISKTFAPDTFASSVSAVLEREWPLSLGNFAEFVEDNWKDDIELQKKVASRIESIPVTPAEYWKWTEIRSTEPVEVIAANKMAEAATSASILAETFSRLQIRYGSALNIMEAAMISKCASFNECFLVFKKIARTNAGEIAEQRCLKYAKSKKQREQVRTFYESVKKQEKEEQARVASFIVTKGKMARAQTKPLLYSTEENGIGFKFDTECVFLNDKDPYSCLRSYINLPLPPQPVK